MKIVIIEDEVNNILLIQELLKSLPFKTEVVGVAAVVEQAVTLLSETKPDVVLMDIMIRGGTGFNVLDEISNYSFELIFITAYKQYGIDAIKKGAFDYILKPIHTEEFLNTMKNCKAKIAEKNRINELLHSDSEHYFTIKSQAGTEIYPLNDIIFFEADGSYTNCVFQGYSRIISKSIGDVEKALPKESFFRCHHSFIINMEHIQKVEMSRSGSVTCTDEHILPVSQRKKKEFIRFLDKKPGFKYIKL